MNKPILAFAWYKKEQFESFRNSAQDKEEFSETFEKWEKNAKKSYKEYTREGFEVRKVILKYDEFCLWCKVNGKKNIAKSRSEYAARKAQEG